MPPNDDPLPRTSLFRNDSHHRLHVVNRNLCALAPTAADDAGNLSSSLGLVLDAQAVFGGPRLKRGAIVIDNGKVLSVAIEPAPGEGKQAYFES